MPPFLPVILAGAAMYATYKWVQRQVAEQAAEAKRAAEQSARRAAVAPRDLGDLEYDTSAGAYVPRGRD